MIKIKRILCPTDFSEYAKHALNYACDLTDKYDAELQKIPNRKWSAAHKVVHATSQGVAYAEIIQYAEVNRIDLIVIGTGTALNHALMGSVAEKIVRKSPCPVMLIHPKDR